MPAPCSTRHPGNPISISAWATISAWITLRTVNADTVAERYTLQRPFLGLVAQSAPLFLVNGNHEQASLFNFNQPTFAMMSRSGRKVPAISIFPRPLPMVFTAATPSR